MDKNLPARPNLDHLRRQAKELLAAFRAGDAEALATLREHLPEAKRLTAAELRAADLRLADAQSAVARKTGFASWPQLARHVDQLRALEGAWAIARLEVDGAVMPPDAGAASQLLIDGDRFRFESPGANYEGVFNIDVEAQPHHIDIEFVEGPEAGNWNFGIFRIDGDQLEICLDMNGKPHPTDFRTSPGSGHAYETLTRISTSRPEAVQGGKGPRTKRPPTDAKEKPPSAPPAPEGFQYVESPTLTRLQGEWAAEQLVTDGQEVPPQMCAHGRRTAKNNEIKVVFGGQLMIHALVRVNESASPMEIDYYNLIGAAKGAVQHGILEWRGDAFCACMGLPGQPRPTDFTCPTGSGRTLSCWRRRP